jgi:hypothetical protein
MLKKGAIVVVLVGAAVAASGVASGNYNCNAGEGCIYDDNNYIALLATKNAGAGLTNVGSGANDKTDSWRNESSRHGAWYYDVNGGGNCYNLVRHSSNPNLSVNPSDELSSWRMNGLCGG